MGSTSEMALLKKAMNQVGLETSEPHKKVKITQMDEIAEKPFELDMKLRISNMYTLFNFPQQEKNKHFVDVSI